MPVQQRIKITYRYAITSQKAVRSRNWSRQKSLRMKKIMIKASSMWLNNDLPALSYTDDINTN